MRLDISIIVPAYNEEKLIEASLKKVLKFFRGKKFEYEVVVVDDGSKDKTASIVAALRRSNLEIKLIKNPHKGKGFAVYTGVKNASGNYLCFCDADLSTPIEEFERLWEKVAEGFEVVIASREGKGAKRVGEPLYRHIMGRIFNYLVQLLAVRGINDTQCGFKLFEATVAKKIFSKLKLYGENAQELKEAAVTAYDVEVLFLARKMGFKIAEIPVLWEFRNETRVNPLRDSLRNFLDIVKVRVNDLGGRYD